MVLRRVGRLCVTVLVLTTAFAQQRPAPRASDMDRAVEEFKTQTRNLGLRTDSPRQTNANGGGLQWHGRVFEYFRNDVLDAVPHEIRQRGGDKSLLRRNQFGFNIAGPVDRKSVV